jgi:thiol-disulfide isomerase/thioredoxin
MKTEAKQPGQRASLTITAFLIAVLVPVAVLGQANNVAPDWTLLSAQGETVQLSEEIQEQPVVLLFWATWCPYCKALMPHLHSLRLEHGDEIKILAVNFREDGNPVEFIKDAGYDFTVLPNGDEVAAAYNVYGTPGLIIVDQEQIIRFDLRSLPRREPPFSTESSSHKRIAAYRAPYWAAEIRKSLDAVLEDAAQ